MHELQEVLEGKRDDNPFQLDKLQEGQCSFSSQRLEWLPEPKSRQLSECHLPQFEINGNIKKKKKAEKGDKPIVPMNLDMNYVNANVGRFNFATWKSSGGGSLAHTISG